MESIINSKLDDLFGEGGVQEFATKMSKDGEWGDGSMLSFASLLYNKQIVVYQEENPPITS